MTNYSAVMVDLESLSVKPTATVLSISAVAFNPLEVTKDFSNNPKLDLLLDIETQAHRHVQDETLAWWTRQDQKVQDKMFGTENRISVEVALKQFSKFVWQKNQLWAQGVTFDIVVLENLLEEYKMATPWPYHIVRDSRTLLDLVDIPKEPVSHDSIEDCFVQIRAVQKALQILNVTRFSRMR